MYIGAKRTRVPRCTEPFCKIVSASVLSVHKPAKRLKMNYKNESKEFFRNVKRKGATFTTETVNRRKSNERFTLRREKLRQLVILI